MMRRCAGFVSLLALLTPAFAQHGSPVHVRTERIVAIVPMIGAGTWDDPKRPMFVPGRGEARSATPGITSFRYQVSDDARFAIVEFQAPSRRELKAILESTASGVKALDPTRLTKAQAEAELKLVKRDFDLDRFLGGRP